MFLMLSRCFSLEVTCKGRRQTAVSCAFPDLSLVGECHAHIASIQPVF